MTITQTSQITGTLPDDTAANGDIPSDEIPRHEPVELRVLRRNGTVATFDADRISVAITKAFLAVEGAGAGQSERLRILVAELTNAVVGPLTSRYGRSGAVAIPLEQVQDQVELQLMRGGHSAVARAYILYREEHRKAREAKAAADAAEDVANVDTASELPRWHMTRGEQRIPIDYQQLQSVIVEACEGLSDVDNAELFSRTVASVYDGMSAAELAQSPILTVRELVEVEPNYSLVAARLLAHTLRSEALTYLDGAPRELTAAQMRGEYAAYFGRYVTRGIELEQLDPQLAEFDLARLGAALDADADLRFTYLGLQTLYDRYLLHDDGHRYELPQAFYMRIAMGLAVREDDRTGRALEFYRLLSSHRFMCSTPTLFNAGTTRPQLSSCFLTTVPDDLDGIFSAIRDNALLAKYSGGIGNDWTPVRGIGAHIRGTNGKSLGIVPFLKIANDTAVAVNQGGKRKGAVCAYLEPWHIDVEEFLDLRRNTGDERRRTHDMNTAVWVPDLLIQRVEANAEWTLFSPDETADLHQLYGTEFADRYREYEAAASRGDMRVHRTIPAVDLWRKLLTVLFETGHPWMCFKDACNIRSPQQHAGVVHSSNLCTEITLNTSPGAEGEVAVCNLGSINLAAHTGADGIDVEALRDTVRTAVRMLDNVIDVNMYTIPQAKRANMRHRPVGLGLMGFADALVTQGISYASEKAVDFADSSMELISYYALEASAELASERGAYESFAGSLWSKGILPIDSIAMLAEARGGDMTQNTDARLDWESLRVKVMDGMRNSNVMAIAPTATISNIVGVTQSIEPFYRNLYVKANMSGNFTVMNTHLVAELKSRGLWDEAMVADLKYFDGSLQPISRVPDDIKQRYATAFEIDGSWLVKAASRRQKWIDQAQSLNLYMATPDGRALDELYRLAWRLGLKTTYYLRSTSKTHVEKSTLRGTDGRLNAVAVQTVAAPVADPTAAALEHAASAAASDSASTLGSAPELTAPDPDAEPAVCSILEPDCEACQ